MRLWLLLKVPALIVAPKMEAVWLNFGEIAVLFAAGWIILAKLGELSSAPPLTIFAGQKSVWLATMLFGLALIPIGLSHIFYTKQTVDLIPTWLPLRTGLAELTARVRSAAALVFSSRLCHALPR